MIIARGPMGYLAAALFTALAGFAVAARFGVDPPQAAAGSFAAWVIQAIAFGPLERRLREGGDATRAWVIGIGLRVGSLLAAWPLTAIGLFEREAAVVFGLCLAALMILEAIWLAVVSANTGSSNR